MPKDVTVSAFEGVGASFGAGRRLHRPRDFEVITAQRRVLRGENFDLHLAPRDPGEQSRLGCIVPKRLAAAATVRNAIKRQGREAFRLNVPADQAIEMVLRLKRAVPRGQISVSAKPWRVEIEKLMRRVALSSE